MLDLNDEKWQNFSAGYRVPFDASILLTELEVTEDKERINEILDELCMELQHQGDVGVASYLALPHLIRIGVKKQIKSCHIPALVAIIETLRHTDNPPLPKEYLGDYKREIKEVSKLVSLNQDEDWDRNYAHCALSAIAAVNGQINLANMMIEIGDEHLAKKFEFFMKHYDEIKEIIHVKRKESF